MEAAVDKLEALVNKSEAELEYMEKRLKLDFINSSSAAQNPVALLESLRAIKARNDTLSSELQELTSVYTQSMDSIRTNVEEAQEMLRVLRETAAIKEALEAPVPGHSS
ncbi:unnamed protein product [Knipowitschia caucasica]|uniref:Protein FAM33A n=1 Tax=Knipowitschia caucasica TaxID=637954 RepID=A0AAV2JCB0_KNICA